MTPPPVWHIALRLDPSADLRAHLDVQFHSHSQCTVLHGPSGAGKSLTLQAIAGLLPPQVLGPHSPERHTLIRCHDRLLHDSAQGLCLPARQRQLGYVFQDYALFPHLTVRQNVAFGLPQRQGWRRFFNPGPHRHHPEVEHWLDTLGLHTVAEQYPATLSGGQRQRTALARALCAQAQALLLDEPFAALDAPLRERLRAELLELLERTGIPLLLVSHDADDLACFGQTQVRLEHGRVVDVQVNSPPRQGVSSA